MNQLLELLNLDQIADNVFIAPASNEPHVRAFGGHIVAQALMAACLTADPQRQVHSFHSYFLRPGSPSLPATCKVNRVRDGRSFATRYVETWQNNEVIFQLSASFHYPESGIEHSDVMPEVPDPESLQTFEERFAGRNVQEDMGRWFVRARPFDIRYVHQTPFDPSLSENLQAQQRVWFKFLDKLPDDQMLHSCLAAYASDMTVLDAALLKHSIKWTDRNIIGASLDHAVWFHRPFRIDEWLLFDQRSPIAFGGRGLASAQVWDQSGHLVMSVMQEALLRPPGTP